jgi:hypothetical protein
MSENYETLLRLFVDLERLNVRLSVDNGKLIVEPGSRLTAEHIAVFKSHRDTILASVERSERLAHCQCGGRLFGIPTFDRFQNFECVRCGQCSGCARLGIPNDERGGNGD